MNSVGMNSAGMNSVGMNGESGRARVPLVPIGALSKMAASAAEVNEMEFGMD